MWEAEIESWHFRICLGYIAKLCLNKKSNTTSGDEQTGAVGWAVRTEHWEHWEDNSLGVCVAFPLAIC